jgi:hypothetical protein
MRLLSCFLHLFCYDRVRVENDGYPVPALVLDAVEGIVGHLVQGF